MMINTLPLHFYRQEKNIRFITFGEDFQPTDNSYFLWQPPFAYGLMLNKSRQT